MAREPEAAVGPVIRKFRHERGLTIEETAQRARLSYQYYGDIERGKENPTVAVLHRVLTVLGQGWEQFGAALDATLRLDD